jgi:putative N-acetylmannosamine-6-phosphate epimerase
MSNTEEVKIQAESLLKILEETKRDGIVKRFYDTSKTRVIPTIRDMQTLYQYDQSLYMNRSTAKFLILTVL